MAHRERRIPMFLAAHSAEHGIRIQRDVARGEDAEFVALQPLGDRAAVLRPQRRGLHELQIRLRANRDDGHRRVDALTAFRLHALEDRAALEAIEVFAEHQLHAVRRHILREPRGCLLVEKARPQRLRTRDQSHVHLQLAQQGRRLHGNESAPDDGDVLLQFHHLAESHQIPRAAQIEDIAEIGTRHFRTPGPAARGEERLAKNHRLPCGNYRRALLQAELRHECVQTKIHFHPAEPRLVMHEQFFHRHRLRSENAGQQVRTAHSRMRFGTDQHDAALLVEGPNGFRRRNPCGAGPDD